MTIDRPTPVQIALLQACLLDGEARQDAITRLRRSCDLDTLDAGSHRLLPLYYRRLVDEGDADPDLGRLKGVHRKAWYENLLLRTNAERILGILHDAGVSTLLLKGCGLHTTVYAHEPALRPLEDIDVLVPADRVPDAVAAVHAAGFTYLPGQIYGEAWSRYLHAGGYGRGFREAVDLHRRPLRFQLDAGYTQRCWDRSVPVRLGDTATSTLDPTDHLLLTMIHGAAPNQVPPCRWVADAVLLVRTGAIDWARLADDAVAVGRPRSVEAALGLLADEFAVAVPQEVAARLRAPRPRRSVALESLAMRRPSRTTLLARALVEDYAMVTIGAGFWRGVVGYPGYVKARSYRGWAGTVRRIGRIVSRGPAAP